MKVLLDQSLTVHAVLGCLEGAKLGQCQCLPRCWVT
jgi:hypothetical protein